MADKIISDYPNAGAIDPAADYFLVQQNATNTYRRITRNNIMGTTGTPVDTTSTQTLQSKTLDNTNILTIRDDRFTLQDNVDTTKQAQFQLAGITAATTRTYTLPNASSTLADISTAQTFTNKTLTAPIITNGSITGTTITTDAIVGQTAATNGTVYGLSITAAKISGASITNATIPTAALASNAVSVVLLDATESTDFVSGLALTANTWTDFKANQNFTVTTSGSIIAITVVAGSQVGGSNIAAIATRVVIDSASTPTNKQVGMSFSPVAAQYTNPFGGSTVYITGLSIGTHTVKTQVLSTTANSAFCRCSSVPNTEFYRTTVVEFKK